MNEEGEEVCQLSPEWAGHMDKVHIRKEEPRDDSDMGMTGTGGDDAASEDQEFYYCNLTDILAKGEDPLPVPGDSDQRKQQKKQNGATNSSIPERKERCPMCPSEFSFTELLIRHMMSKHNAVFKWGKFHCPKCPWTGKKVKTYANHMAQHQAKELECPHCQKAFPNKPQLERHVGVHDRLEKTEQCPICREVLFSLSAHMYTKHGVRKGPRRKAWLRQPKPPRRSCPHCPKQLKGGATGLKNHIRLRHKEVGPIKSEAGTEDDGCSQDVNDDVSAAEEMSVFIKEEIMM